MRLKQIEVVNFSKSEMTNFLEWEKKNPDTRLTANDVLLFVSMKGDQLVFVSPVREFVDGDRKRHVVASRRLRLTDGAWNPYRLVNYAEEVGVEIDGLKRFEEWYRDLKG